MSKVPNFHKSRCKQCKQGKPMGKISWDWVDEVYCISLKDREDRARESEAEFHKVGLCDKVVFYRPVKDTSDFKRPGTRGCWYSHHNIAKKAVKNKAKMMLIFEDDVEFDSETTTKKSVNKIVEFTKKLRNWNIIYLGHWSMFSLPTRFLDLHRAYSMAAHAYLISNDALKWLATTKYEDGIWFHKSKKSAGLGIDVFYMMMPRVYAYYPMLAYQRGSKTSNQRPPHKIGQFLIDLVLTDPRFMKYNQFLIFILSLLLVCFIIFKLGQPVFNW